MMTLARIRLWNYPASGNFHRWGWLQVLCSGEAGEIQMVNARYTPDFHASWFRPILTKLCLEHPQTDINGKKMHEIWRWKTLEIDMKICNRNIVRIHHNHQTITQTQVYNTTTDSEVDSSRWSAVSMDKSERWGKSPERISQWVRCRNKRGVALGWGHWGVIPNEEYP